MTHRDTCTDIVTEIDQCTGSLGTQSGAAVAAVLVLNVTQLPSEGGTGDLKGN